MTPQSILILQGDVSEIQWKTKDAGVVTHTVEEFDQIIRDAKIHKLLNQQKYWLLEQQVLNATIKEEVLAIVW
jgi:hypothetical protein